MGLLSWLFGKDDSVADTTATGAALGAAIGDKLDERAQRDEALKLQRLAILQREHHFKMQQTDRNLDLISENLRESRNRNIDWEWWWEPPDVCQKLHQQYALSRYSDETFCKLNKQLVYEWKLLEGRAEAVGLMSIIYMPRSIGGDIAGTPKVLRWAMSKLRARIEICERAIEIQHQYRMNDE